MQGLDLLKLRDFRKYFPITYDEYGITVLWCTFYFSKEDTNRIRYKMHRHAFFEAHFVLSGSVTYQTADQKTFVINEGEFVVFPPNCEHMAISQSDNLKKCGLAFGYSPTDEVELVFLENPVICRKKALDSVFELMSLALESKSGVHFLKPALLSLVLLSSFKVINRNEKDLTFEQDERALRAKKFVLDNCYRDISTDEVATFMHLSLKQTERIFIKSEGVTLASFIRGARLEKAKELLKSHELTISQVAEKLGFSNEYNFNRFFKRLMGITPGKYKNNLT